MKPKSMAFAIAIAVVIACSSSLSLWAQGGNSPSSQQPSAPSASQGSATIENQMITYEVLRQMAAQIADRVALSCQPPNCNSVLLADPNAQSEMITAKAFDNSAEALRKAYVALVPHGAEAAAAPSLSDVASLLTAVKSSATYSNQNFQPTSQSIVTLLTIALDNKRKGLLLRTSTLPGDVGAAAQAVQLQLGDIAKAQKEVKDEKARADLDKQFDALRTALASTSTDGTVLATIIKGKALLSSLGTSFSILTVSVDAAGGDTKVTHFFWQELIMPTPSPSYNGGAVVSFLLTDPAGKFQDGDILHYMYDFSKWKSPKVPKTFNSDLHLQRPVAGSVPQP